MSVHDPFFFISDAAERCTLVYLLDHHSKMSCSELLPLGIDTCVDRVGSSGSLLHLKSAVIGPRRSRVSSFPV